MAKYLPYNAQSLPPLSSDGSMFSRVMSAGSAVSSNTWMVLGVIALFLAVALFYYFYYVYDVHQMSNKYYANSEHVPAGSGSSKQAELLFFYADWCPHCKTAKPIWNDLKSEYEHQSINGYQVEFTEVNCSEESAEVEKLMDQYNVEGYPTIKLVKDGQIIEYDSKPSKDTLVQFLNKVLV